MAIKKSKKGESVIFHLHMSHVRADLSPNIADLAKVNTLVLVCEAVDKVFRSALVLEGQAVEVPEVGEVPQPGSCTGEGQWVPSVHRLGLGVQQDPRLLT